MWSHPLSAKHTFSDVWQTNDLAIADKALIRARSKGIHFDTNISDMMRTSAAKKAARTGCTGCPTKMRRPTYYTPHDG